MKKALIKLSILIIFAIAASIIIYYQAEKVDKVQNAKNVLEEQNILEKEIAKDTGYTYQNPKIIVSNKIHYHYLQHQKSILKNEDLLKENYVVQSAEYVSNLDVFQSAKPLIKNQILNKYAQSMIDESQTFYSSSFMLAMIIFAFFAASL